MSDEPGSHGTLHFHRFTYTKADLKAVGDEEAVFFLMSCQLHNDIATLFRVLLQNPIRDEDPEPVRNAAAITQLLIIRMLAGRCYEGWEFVKARFGTYFKKHDSRIKLQAKDNYKTLKKYFGRKSLIQLLRNKVAFHSSIESFSESYANLSDEESFVDHHHSARGNTVFFGAELVLTQTIISLVEKPDPLEALIQVGDEVREIAGQFLDVTGAFIAAFCSFHLPDAMKRMNDDVVAVPDQPTPGAMRSKPFLFVQGKSAARKRALASSASTLPLADSLKLKR